MWALPVLISGHCMGTIVFPSLQAETYILGLEECAPIACLTL